MSKYTDGSTLRFDMATPDSDVHEYARPSDTLVLHEIRDGVPSGRFLLAHIVASGELDLHHASHNEQRVESGEGASDRIVADDEMSSLLEALERFAARRRASTVDIRARA